MKVFGFDTEKTWEYENGFYLTSDPRRIAKLTAHYELYKQTINLPGQVVECGVFKGASFIRLLTFRDILENSYSRKIIGFDAFGKFPEQKIKEDADFAKSHDESSGHGISRAELTQILDKKGMTNYELIEGDVIETIPTYIKAHPELKISLLHIDVDVYAPTKAIMENLYSRVVEGGIIVLDDYSLIHGETRAVDEFFAGKSVEIKKLSTSHSPSYIIKKTH